MIRRVFTGYVNEPQQQPEWYGVNGGDAQQVATRLPQLLPQAGSTTMRAWPKKSATM
jgi:hypothetical protein